MLNLFKKQRGAVTVFLVIILVPTITICSLFVDVSRVQLAKPVVDSAGNLALNTMLTEYDMDLNNFFGLLGSCQNTEDLKTLVKQYFVDALKSQGIDNSETEGILGRLDQMFEKDSDIADLLAIEANDVEISEVSNGNLANPALVKQQIVEFMKYRAPIDLASGLIDTIKQVAASSKAAKAEAEVTKAKQKYYEAENELLKKLKQIYDVLRKYNRLNITNEYIREVKGNISGEFKNQYKKIHKKVVYDLINTSGLRVFSPENIKYKVSQFNDSDYHTDIKYTANNKAKKRDVQLRANNLISAISNYIRDKKSIDSYVWNYNAYDSSIYKTQYWAQSMALINNNYSKYTKYIQSAKQMGRAYWLFNNACQNTNQTEEITIGNNIEINNYLGKSDYVGVKSISYSINGRQNFSLAGIYKNLAKDFDTDGFYGKVSLRLKNISEQAVNGNASLDIGTGGTEGSVGTIGTSEAERKIDEICSKAKEYYNKFKKAKEYLKDAYKYLRELGDSNSGLIKRLKESFQEWDDKTKALEKTDSEMISDNDGDLKDEKKIIDEVLKDSNVKELSDRVNKIKELVETVYSNINSTKYNGNQLKKIENLSIFISKSGINKNRISIKTAELSSYAESSFRFSEGSRNINLSTTNNPDIDRVNPPDLYRWMKKKFKNQGGDMTEDEAEDTYDEYKDDSEKSDYDDSEVGKSSNEIKGLDGLPSDGNGSEEEEKTAQLSAVTSFISTLFSGGILSSLENLGKRFRDNLYTTDYIMNMFSYDTFVNEGKYNYYADKNDTVTLTNYIGKYGALSEDEFEKNPDKTFRYNKSLTNQMINADNHYDYLGEVEYILYGNTNVINKANAYGKIFLLRYAFNIAPVFQKYWKEPEIIEIASVISAATYGVIPESLIKLAICLIITVAETTYDLMCLRAGIGVKLIKGKDELAISFSRKNGVKTNKNKRAKGTFMPQYSDYLSLFVFIKLSSSSENQVYKRIADVIQTDMQKITDNNKYRLNKSVVYYQIKSSIRIKPLLLDLEINQGKNSFQFNTLCDYEYKNIAGY